MGVKALQTSVRADLELRVEEQDTGASVNLCDTHYLALSSLNRNTICSDASLKKKNVGRLCVDTFCVAEGLVKAEELLKLAGTRQAHNYRGKHNHFWLELMLEKSHRPLFAPLNKLYSIYALSLCFI